ncbi:hypothetical protein ACQEVY_18765 [Streptomyces sp. CA-288835]|uniref:hypothetical protein n=1 Tax=Streptomyces sp. CA-288835 TaxID=3240069 RepID=UPI003D8A8923
MHLRKTLATAALGSALVVGPLMAPAAQAAEKPETASATVAQKAPAPLTAQGQWEYHSWYWTYANCHEAGKDLVNDPRWTDYTCTDHSSGVTVLLWMWKP